MGKMGGRETDLVDSAARAFLRDCGIGASAMLATCSVTWAPIGAFGRATIDRNSNITGPG